jgi:hypothetical protein
VLYNKERKGTAVRGKIVPVLDMKAYWWIRGATPHSFLTSALDGVSGLLHGPGIYTLPLPGTERRCPLNARVGRLSVNGT